LDRRPGDLAYFREAGIDCGAGCLACVFPPHCTDGVQDGDETGVDCGGSCAPCFTGPTTPGAPDGTVTTVAGGTNAPGYRRCSTFHEGRAPSTSHVAAVAVQVEKRMRRWLRRRGLVDERKAEDRSNEAPALSPLEACMQASLFAGEFLRVEEKERPPEEPEASEARLGMELAVRAEELRALRLRIAAGGVAFPEVAEWFAARLRALEPSASEPRAEQAAPKARRCCSRDKSASPPAPDDAFSRTDGPGKGTDGLGLGTGVSVFPRAFRKRDERAGGATSGPATRRAFRQRDERGGGATSRPAARRAGRRRPERSGSATSGAAARRAGRRRDERAGGATSAPAARRARGGTDGRSGGATSARGDRRALRRRDERSRSATSGPEARRAFPKRDERAGSAMSGPAARRAFRRRAERSESATSGPATRRAFRRRAERAGGAPSVPAAPRAFRRRPERSGGAPSAPAAPRALRRRPER
jgi:hypothetical protein